jgi:hypothetical protein
VRQKYQSLQDRLLISLSAEDQVQSSCLARQGSQHCLGSSGAHLARCNL